MATNPNMVKLRINPFDKRSMYHHPHQIKSGAQSIRDTWAVMYGTYNFSPAGLALFVKITGDTPTAQPVQKTIGFVDRFGVLDYLIFLPRLLHMLGRKIYYYPGPQGSKVWAGLIIMLCLAPITMPLYTLTIALNAVKFFLASLFTALLLPIIGIGHAIIRYQHKQKLQPNPHRASAHDSTEKSTLTPDKLADIKTRLRAQTERAVTEPAVPSNEALENSGLALDRRATV